ncbi:hypothetical protein [Solidesulfovibrio alcoholivorans]|uniref:hypothetical protein n=1 Tax=Solidesulfovibrio alcoholivorans TaxID=81406 RepID=UPI000494DE9B|nr:hypothetical protein [Solidesulfovibrio alcoholivorans]
MRNLESRLTRLEAACPAGHGLESAHAFARTAMEIKTGHEITDGPLLDRLTTWGADHGVSVKGLLDRMSRVDRMASNLGGDEAVPGTGDYTDIFGKGADELLAMLDAGRADERDLLTLYGFQPQEQ